MGGGDHVERKGSCGRDRIEGKGWDGGEASQNRCSFGIGLGGNRFSMTPWQRDGAVEAEHNGEGIVPQGWRHGTPQNCPPRHWCFSRDSNEKEPPRDIILLQPKAIPVTLWTRRQCQHSCILLQPNLDGNPADSPEAARAQGRQRGLGTAGPHSPGALWVSHSSARPQFQPGFMMELKN